jgi:flavin reductase (DIM6/NTAB) family NADH-FMN oxidoreductase RutF
MRIAAKDLETEATYKLITGIVVPRPIAWVTTLSPSGSVNLAPFSFFTCVSPKPALLAISVGRSGGVYKDTARNILALEEYVIHIADFCHLEALHLSATEYPPDVSEVEEAGLATVPSDEVKVPRLRDAPVAMECRFRDCIEFGHTRNRLIVGRRVSPARRPRHGGQGHDRRARPDRAPRRPALRAPRRDRNHDRAE